MNTSRDIVIMAPWWCKPAADITGIFNCTEAALSFPYRSHTMPPTSCGLVAGREPWHGEQAIASIRNLQSALNMTFSAATAMVKVFAET
jgi:hypothetical protein